MNIDTRGLRTRGTWVFDVTEFNFEARCDRGHLEAAMASEATKMAVRGNMHMDTHLCPESKKRD